MQNYLDLINKEAAQTTDMNVASSGGFNQTILESGSYLGALVGYIDLGDQPDEYQGEVKGNFPKVRLEFAVFSYIEVDGQMQMDTENPVILRQELFLKNNERAGSFKAFKAMNYANDPSITHFAQFLGKPFMFSVVKAVAKQSKREYNRLDLSKTAPAVDPMTRQPYALPKIDEKWITVFLWNNPIKEMWDKLYIDGTRDDGTSKNFIQDEIIGATNYHGSALQLLLEGSGQALPTPSTEPTPAPTPEAAPEAPQQPEAPTPVPTPAPAAPMPTPAPAVETDDIVF